MARILCLGYSVTERPGYLEKARILAEAEGRDLDLIRCGWGGHTIKSVAFMIEEILDGIACDLVLLELFTGFLRQHLAFREILRHLDEILAATARRALPVAFLNLHQTEVDGRDDRLTRAAHAYARDYGIPMLDVASLFSDFGAASLSALFPDGIHTSQAGADLYGNLVYFFLRDVPVRRTYVPYFANRPSALLALPVARLTPEKATYGSDRNGIPIAFLEIAEGRSVDLVLGEPRDVRAVMVAYGPTAGRMRIADANGTGRRDILPYDPICYYTRSGVFDLELRSVRALTVSQFEGVPDLALWKGEKDYGPRVGRVSHLFCRRSLSVAERWRYGRHRLKRLTVAWRRRAGRLETVWSGLSAAIGRSVLRARRVWRRAIPR